MDNKIVSVGNVGTVIFRAFLEETKTFTEAFIDVKLFIDKSEITVTLESASKAYGEADPEFGYEVNSGSLKNNETLVLTREEGENVGSYDIFPSVVNSNYAIEYSPASLNIEKASIVILADAQTKVYGVSDPVLSYSIVSGALASWDTLVLEREEGENVGNYPIYSTLDALNYNITYTGADLSVVQRDITVTADSQTKVYGEADPDLTYLIAFGNTVEGDVLEGSLIRESGENIGEYGIYSNLSNANYRITYIQNSLTITIADITLEIYNITKNFREDDPEFTYSITSENLFDRETIQNSIQRDSGEKVGVYQLRSDFTSENCNITIVAGSLQIQEIEPIVVTMDAKDITGTSVYIKGELISSGGVDVFQQGFLIGLSESDMVFEDSNKISKVVLSTLENFIKTEEALQSETTYYYRAFARNSKGRGFGEIKTFKTLDITAPIAPSIFTAATFTCPNNTETTSDNNFIIRGVSEPENVIEVFINGESVGFSDANTSGEWELDLSTIDQEDGNYQFTAIGTDLSSNSSILSEVYSLLISTENSDLDTIPDYCDEDIDNDGYIDATEIKFKRGYGISPNGDGVNDILVIKNIEDYPSNELTIYSRSGALVYKKNAYDNTWNGSNMFTNGNARLPEGAYFFALNLNVPGEQIVQGWIYIRY